MTAFQGLAHGFEAAGGAAQDQAARPGPWLWQGGQWGAAAGEGGRRVNRLEGTSDARPFARGPLVNLRGGGEDAGGSIGEAGAQGSRGATWRVPAALPPGCGERRTKGSSTNGAPQSPKSACAVCCALTSGEWAISCTPRSSMNPTSCACAAANCCLPMSEIGASEPMVRKGQIALTSPAPSRADATFASDCACRTMKTFRSSAMLARPATRPGSTFVSVLRQELLGGEELPDDCIMGVAARREQRQQVQA